MHFIIKFFTFCPQFKKKWLLLISFWSLFSIFTTQAATPEKLGQIYAVQGHFEKAIHHWQAALDLDNSKPSKNLEIMMQLSQAYQALGLSQQALTTLSQAELLSEQLPKPLAPKNRLILAKLFVTKSDISLATRKDIQARFYADKSLNLLPLDAPALIRATVLNNLGNVLTVEAYYAKAVKIYGDAVDLAQLAKNALLSGRILINMAYAYSKKGQWNATLRSLLLAQQQFLSLGPGYAKTFGLISVGELALRFLDVKRPIQNLNNKIQLIVYNTLNTTITQAKNLDNPRLISYSYGFLAHLYETQQRYKEALNLTRQAIFYAKLDNTSFFTQQDQASEILYRWQWQLGRLFKALKQTNKAIEALKDAVRSLQPIRFEMTIGYRRTEQSFRERVGPVYFELADLLLQRAEQNHTQQQHDLTQTFDTIERFKTAELQDYFQDDCVIHTQLKQTTLLNELTPNTAIIYPIMLPTRTAILLSLQSGIQQFSLPITASRMKDEVNEFRFELEADNTTLFLDYAKRLYDWLIAPLSTSLKAQGIDTLIIVPDGVLRTIPFAALHDGKQFLIQKYAVVTTPGLTLTESKVFNRAEAKILLNGLSESVQGYSGLANVRSEINAISGFYPSRNVTQLLNQDFTVNKFSETLKSDIYSILHLASHSQFDSDPHKTFLLTYDGKLRVSQLEALIRLSERRQEPLELLTLSACQTAVGDDQAALGLAGIALKAGAKSALASLWFIDDKATSILMTKFYQQLQQKGLSKAKALQTAQQYLLGYYRYRHPAYWSPFLLIGDWK